MPLKYYKHFILSVIVISSAITYNSQPLKADPLENRIDTYHGDIKPSHVRGARIYDDFIIETDAIVPAANPYLLVANPTDPNMTPPSITDGWRCSHCHGFDYKGGIYTFENGQTNNLIGLKDVRKLTEDDVFYLLMDGLNIFDGITNVNVHNYSTFLSLQEAVDVADFVVNEIFDTDPYIRSSTNEGLVNHMGSMYIYKGLPADTPIPAVSPVVRVDGSSFLCITCHGPEGRLLPGFDLYKMAWTDPFKWLHRVNFGAPRSLLTYPNITAEDITVHPGMYELLLTRGLTFGGAEQASGLLEYVQTHFVPAAPVATSP